MWFKQRTIKTPSSQHTVSHVTLPLTVANFYYQVSCPTNLIILPTPRTPGLHQCPKHQRIKRQVYRGAFPNPSNPLPDHRRRSCDTLQARCSLPKEKSPTPPPLSRSLTVGPKPQTRDKIDTFHLTSHHITPATTEEKRLSGVYRAACFNGAEAIETR